MSIRFRSRLQVVGGTSEKGHTVPAGQLRTTDSEVLEEAVAINGVRLTASSELRLPKSRCWYCKAWSQASQAWHQGMDMS